MKKLLFKSLVFGSAIIMPAVALTSCSSQVSQYGINASVTSNYNTTNTEENKTFGGYFFNNTQVSAASNLTDGNDYSTLGWTGVLAPNVLLINGLIVLTTFSPKLSDPFLENNIFVIDNNDKRIFQEFILAASNVMNEGKSGQIKFGFTGVETEFKNITNDTPTRLEQTNSVYAEQDQALQVGTKENEEKKIAYYDSNISFTLKVKLGYWNSNVNKPTNGEIDFQKVIDYVKKYNLWKIDDQLIVPQYKNFEIKLNYSMRIRATYSGLTKSYEAATNNKPTTYQDGSGSSQEDNKPSIETIKLVKEDFESIKPSLSVISYTPISSFNNQIPTAELSTETLAKDISTISNLIAKPNENTAKELIDKYKFVLTLSATSYN